MDKYIPGIIFSQITSGYVTIFPRIRLSWRIENEGSMFSLFIKHSINIRVEFLRRIFVPEFIYMEMSSLVSIVTMLFSYIVKYQQSQIPDKQMLAEKTQILMRNYNLRTVYMNKIGKWHNLTEKEKMPHLGIAGIVGQNIDIGKLRSVLPLINIIEVL